MVLTLLLQLARAQEVPVTPTVDPPVSAELHFVLQPPPAPFDGELSLRSHTLMVDLVPSPGAALVPLCVAPCSVKLAPGPTDLWFHDSSRWALPFSTELRPGRSTVITVRPRRAFLENLGGCTWTLGTAAVVTGTSLAWRSFQRGDNQTGLLGAVIATNGLGLAAIGVGVWALGTPKAVESPYVSSSSTGLNE